MTDHPTPWRVEERWGRDHDTGAIDTGEIYIVDAAGNCVCQENEPEYAAETRALYEAICTAMNAHEALVGAVKTLIDGEACDHDVNSCYCFAFDALRLASGEEGEKE